MAEVIEVAHLYELDGSGTRYGKTLGFYEDRAAAEAAGSKLGHYYFEVEEGLPAIRLDDGRIFLLRQRESVVLGGPGLSGPSLEGG